MRQLLLYLTILITIVACNTSDNRNIKVENDPQLKVIPKNSRNILIEELKKLREIIVSTNKEKISEIFTFPISDKSLNIFLEDSIFNEQLKANDNKITKQMFLSHYKQISENIWLDQLTNLLQRIPIDSLLYKDTLELDGYNKKEPCYMSYRIEIIKDSVVLRMDMYSNKSYVTKNLSQEDIPENSSEFCEHSFWWNFYFDGTKLHLKNIEGAG